MICSVKPHPSQYPGTGACAFQTRRFEQGLRGAKNIITIKTKIA
jgi:hypothetical protein